MLFEMILTKLSFRQSAKQCKKIGAIKKFTVLPTCSFEQLCETFSRNDFIYPNGGRKSGFAGLF
jgi:hypothetical protein